MRSSLSVGVLAVLTTATALIGAVAAAPPVAWHVRGEAWGTPAADETSVYYTTPRHEIVALESATGRERWRAHTKESGNETLGYGPVVAGDAVLVGDYDVVAFARADGALRWRFAPKVGHAPGPYIGEVAGGVLLTGSAAGRVHAVDVETGAAKWSTLVADDLTSTVFAPVIADDIVVAGFTEFISPGSRGGVVALDLKTGAMRWKRYFPEPSEPTLGTNSAGGPLLYGELVIATSGDGIVYALQRGSGEIVWSLPRLGNLPPGSVISPDREYRALAISGSTLLAGSLTGVIVAFDLAARRELWRFYDSWLGSAVFRVSADDRRFYLPFFSGEVVALDAATGIEQWRVGDWRAGFIWAPLIWKDKLFVCATRDGLFAFHRVSPEPP